MNADAPIPAQEAANRQLLRSLFSEHAGYVEATLRRLGVPPRDRDDLLQEVFLAVYRALDGYDASRPAKPWLFAFCFRVAANYRRLGRNRSEELGERDAETQWTPEDEASAAEAQTMLARALETLSDDYRAVFVMHTIDGASGPEIAEALGINLNTVYSRIRVARQSVESTLQELMRAGGTS